MKRIFVTAYGDVSELEALTYARELLDVCPERTGLVTWEDGFRACFREYRKHLSISVWKSEGEDSPIENVEK